MAAASRRRPRKLTKPQRARADRVFHRALHGAEACLGARLVARNETMAGGEVDRSLSMVRFEDAELNYTLWLWTERKPPGD